MKRPETKNRDASIEKPLLLKQDFSEIILENQNLKKALIEKQAELEVLQTKLSHIETLTELATNGATIAHELNNPLTVICAETDEILDLLQETKPEKDPIKECANNIKKYSRRMRTIINHFQAISSNAGEKAWKKQNLGKIIEKSVALINPQLKQKNIELISKLQNSLPEIWGNANKLESILQNLFINAIDALDEMENDREKQLYVSATYNTEFVFLKIKDTGPGIPQNLRNQVFTPFFTTKKDKGTGLGLAIVLGCIKEHNGHISLNSDANLGTEFTIKFPLERRNGKSQESLDH